MAEYGARLREKLGEREVSEPLCSFERLLTHNGPFKRMLGDQTSYYRRWKKNSSGYRNFGVSKRNESLFEKEMERRWDSPLGHLNKWNKIVINCMHKIQT